MKYQELYQIIKRPYFSRMDIFLRGLKIYDYQLSLWRQKGYLKKLKRGFYIFTERQEELRPEEISFLLCEPSYISLESALTFYGLIPEVVYAKTAVTGKKTKKFVNPFGNFAYRHIKQELFFGYNIHETKNGKYLLAEPEKAILDYFYLNQDAVKSREDIEELRLNCEIFNKIIKKAKLNKYLEKYNSKPLERRIKLLFTLC